VNDELIVTDEEGELFDYKPHSKESQRVQEALFHEKQTLIENCLFGVDINPNSVKICRLRLWIELLKNAYYKNETELETLPNIDINIKCGNSLVSRFDINSDLKQALKKSKWTIDSYRVAVDTYRNAQNKEEKRKMKELIADIKSDFRSEISSNDPKVRRLQKLNGQLFQLTHQGQLFEMSKKEKAAWEKNVSKLTKQTQKLEAEIEEIKANKIYENAFEWRFEFPEVLNVDGDFMGFDVVIGNPPYAVLEKKRNTPLEPYRDILDYAKETKRYSLVEGGKQNLYRLFLKISHDIARDKTSFGYIIPLTFIGDNSLYKTRNFVFNRFADLKLHCFPQKDNISKRVFEDAKQSTLVILGKIDKNGKVVRPKRLKVFKYPYNSFLDDSEEYEAWISEIKKIDPHRNSIPVVSAKEWEVLKNIHEHPPIRSMNDIKVNRGEINQTIYRDYISSNSNLAKLVKGVQIGQYKINEVLSQGTREFFDEEAFEKNGKKNKHKNNRRIATQRITGIDERLRIVAMIIEPPAYFADSTNSIYVKDQISLEFLLGILNSKLFQWRFKKTSSNNNVSTTQLESLPFCHEPNIASKVKVVVTEIISLKKTNPSADTSDLEAQVDRLVYDLYGLTEEEVGVVEGGDQ